MSLSPVAAAAKRRWWLILIVLAAGSWFAWEEAQEVEEVYSSYGSTMLSGYDHAAGEQLTSSDPRLISSAEIIAGLLLSEEIALAIEEDGGDGAEYVVETQLNSPLITIEAEGKTADAVLTTVQGILDVVPEQLIGALESAAPVHPEAQAIVLREPSNARLIESEDPDDDAFYRAVGSVLLVAPGEPASSVSDGALRFPSHILAEAIQAETEMDAIVEAAGGATTYTVEAAEVGPLMRVRAVGEEEEVEPMVVTVTERMEEILAENPEFTGGMELILTPVATLSKELENTGAVYRVGGGIIAAALAAGVVAALILDAMVAGVKASGLIPRSGRFFLRAWQKTWRLLSADNQPIEPVPEASDPTGSVDSGKDDRSERELAGSAQPSGSPQ